MRFFPRWICWTFGLALVALTARAAAAPVAPAFFRFKIGALDAIALKDGDITLPNDVKTVGKGHAPAEIAELLSAAGQATDSLQLSIQPLLVRTGEHLVLFDTGAGRATFAVAGRLPSALRAAGVSPAEITDVFISHAHPDHLGGLIDPNNGTLAFPNAKVRLSAAEWNWMQQAPELASLAKAIASRVVTFEPGETIVPGVTTVDLSGHTPGHAGAQIVSQGERLLYLGDTAHHSVVSVQRPDWPIGFDVDSAAATARRRALLGKAATDDVRVYAVHFPFPGLGRVRRQGDAFVWVPERN